MRRLRVLLVKALALFHRGRISAALEEELASHLEMHVADNIAAGMSPAEARRDAVSKLGGLAVTTENCRDQRGLPLLETLIKDTRYAVRSLSHARLFTVIAILSLAIGIGANTALFSIADRMLIRSLPVPEADRLVFFQWTGPFIGGTLRGGDTTFSYPAYQELRDHQPGVFTGIAARRQEAVDIGVRESAERATAELVSGNYFDVLQIGAAVGRTLTPEHERIRDGAPYVVLSYNYWQRRFGGSADVPGKALHVNGHPMTVLGVAQRSFAGMDKTAPTDIFVPLSMKSVVTPTWDDTRRRDSFWLHLFGRLRPGVDLAHARGAMHAPYLQSLRNDLATVRRNAEFSSRYLAGKLELLDARNGFGREWFRRPLFVLFAMVGLLLLIACVNVANLLIARAGNRSREIAIRLSLGASKARLARLLGVEALVIAVAAGAAGIILGICLLRLMTLLRPHDAALILPTAFDWQMAAFTAALSLATALLFGLAPIAHALRTDVNANLKDGSNSVMGGRGRARGRKLLVCVQVALSLTLLTAAGLFSRSLSRLMAVDSGLAADQLLVFSVDPSLHRYTPEKTRWLFSQAQQALRTTAGVTSVSAASSRVMAGGGAWENTVNVEGYHPREDEDMQAGWNQFLPGFFATMGVPLVAGRDFDERDTFGARRVALVNAAFARKFCAENCVGKRFGFGGSSTPDREIVGVVADMKHDSLTEKVKPWTFTPALQDPDPAQMSFYLRSPRSPERLAGAARKALATIDPSLPIFDMKTVRAEVQDTYLTERFFAFVSVAFALLATSLALIGLYGVTAYAVARRTPELGMRVALGAGRLEIMRLVISEVGTLTAIGIAAGSVAALLLGRYVESQLYQMKGDDPLVLGISALLMAAAAVTAAAHPLARALRIDPGRALRYQ